MNFEELPNGSKTEESLKSKSKFIFLTFADLALADEFTQDTQVHYDYCLYYWFASLNC